MAPAGAAGLLRRGWHLVRVGPRLSAVRRHAVLQRPAVQLRPGVLRAAVLRAAVVLR